MTCRIFRKGVDMIYVITLQGRVLLFHFTVRVARITVLPEDAERVGLVMAQLNGAKISYKGLFAGTLQVTSMLQVGG